MKRLAVSFAVISSCLVVPVSAHGIYAKAGVLGVGLGGYYGLNEFISVRTDLTTAGKFKRDFNSGSLDFQTSLDANQLGVYVDVFPFQGSFHFSAGVQMRKLQATAQARLRNNSKITINDTEVTVDTSQDTLTGKIKFPTLAPYLGFGWGYDTGGKSGLGFALDVGVAFGNPTASLTASDSLLARLDFASLLTGDANGAAAVEGQRKKLVDAVNKFKVFPQAYLGVYFRF